MVLEIVQRLHAANPSLFPGTVWSPASLGQAQSPGTPLDWPCRPPEHSWCRLHDLWHARAQAALYPLALVLSLRSSWLRVAGKAQSSWARLGRLSPIKTLLLITPIMFFQLLKNYTLLIWDFIDSVVRLLGGQESDYINLLPTDDFFAIRSIYLTISNLWH